MVDSHGLRRFELHLISLTSDNKLSSVIIKKNGDVVMNWQYEYFVDSPGLSKEDQSIVHLKLLYS